MRLDGKTAIVTGGATGIGRAIAELYQREGANIVIADIKGAEAAALEMGDNVLGIITDVADQSSTEAMAAAAIDRFGGIDILVNNAAIFTGLNYTPMESIEVDAWRKLMDVNVMGPWLCARAVVPSMRERGGGRIINIASVISHIGLPFMLHYTTSKGGVAALTRGLARELGTTKSGILVNAISPGYVHSSNAVANSDQHEQFEGAASSLRLIERAQTPQDIAGAAIWLASDEGSYVNGQNILVDGGIYFSQ